MLKPYTCVVSGWNQVRCIIIASAVICRFDLCFCVQSEASNVLSAVFLSAQEYKRKQLEEQRQSERLQRQLQQEHAYLVSLQQQQQDKKPQLYHYNKNLEPNNKPTWAREVPAFRHFNH